MLLPKATSSAFAFKKSATGDFGLGDQSVGLLNFDGKAQCVFALW